ncbi:protein white-like [Condylostylus longicornis]|uniref:protein white-like n=1 Tax=Condylostylus longicornis TaxID=2530218 RepID=UPI00244DFA8D|nr:protein white-like [Condylostylus longicornis]
MAVCNQLSLAKCRFNPIGTESGVGGISGGERKRLNVASEVLTSPTILFADEPTTGLDSFMAESVVNVLKSMTASGRTVIATIHQPSSKIFELFQDLLLLSEGRLVYFGDRVGATEWFKRLGFPCPQYTNPADHIIKVRC